MFPGGAADSSCLNLSLLQGNARHPFRILEVKPLED